MQALLLTYDYQQQGTGESVPFLIRRQLERCTGGSKKYVKWNHLGNVLATITDQKMPVEDGSSGTVAYWNPKVVSYSDYYPFGSKMPGRYDSDETYRFGFQGQETDDEVYGEGNAVSYKYRVHDPRIGRFLSVDPLQKEYPQWGPYVFSGNRLLDARELEGMEPDQINEDNEKNITTLSDSESGEEFKIGGDKDKFGFSRDEEGKIFHIWTPSGRNLEWDDEIGDYIDRDMSALSEDNPVVGERESYYLEDVSEFDPFSGESWQKLGRTSDAWMMGWGPYNDPEDFTGEDLGKTLNNQMPGRAAINIIHGEVTGKNMYGEEMSEAELNKTMGLKVLEIAVGFAPGPFDDIGEFILRGESIREDVKKYTDGKRD